MKRKKRKFSVSVTSRKRPLIDNLKSMSFVLSALLRNVKELLEKRKDRPCLRGKESKLRWKRLARNSSEKMMQD